MHAAALAWARLRFHIAGVLVRILAVTSGVLRPAVGGDLPTVEVEERAKARLPREPSRLRGVGG
jgi:hypothetical protein